jgi:hypothetical protein
MTDGILLSWLLALLVVGFVGGAVAGLRIGRGRPSEKALKAHDAAVVRALIELVRQHQAKRAEEADDA